jgi:hypothetical protein
MCYANMLGQVNITFVPYFNGEEIVKDKFFPLNDKDSVKIEKFRFYVSNVFIENTADTSLVDSNYYLINVFDSSKNKIGVNSPAELGSEISFNIGVDSVTNYGGVKGGALDPMHNMYWSWQSGYINIKLEGVFINNKEYTYHLGGFKYPYNALKKVTLTLRQDLVVYIDFFELFKKINLNEYSKVMSPSKKSIELSELISKEFKTK